MPERAWHARFVLIAYIGGVICGGNNMPKGRRQNVLIAYIGGVICGLDTIINVNEGFVLIAYIGGVICGWIGVK